MNSLFGRKATGITLIEIILAFVIVGILSVLLIPKLVVSDSDVQSNTIGRTTSTMNAMQNALEAYQAHTGTSLDFNTVGLRSIFANYGKFFALKETAPRHYFLFTNQTRIFFTNDLIFGGSTTDEYNPAPLGAVAASNPWRNPATNTGTCGSYSDNQCFFADLNGEAGPNAVGIGGDLIPFRVDPASGTIRTLYDWQKNDIGTTGATLCRFASAYDEAMVGTGC
ncbi:MAG: type II secretion system protein [Cyanobacteria bacterium HKST-UBA06]|nr:type II secretion system protein [Cyanobacteria bacterium HKST-UBA06]